MIDFLLSNSGTIASVAGGVGVLLGYRSLKKEMNNLFKHGVDLYKNIQEAKADGKYTPDEIDKIFTAGGKFMSTFVVLLIKVKRLFKKNG